MYHYVTPREILAVQGLGVLQRANPLPAGRYWIDVFGDNRDKLARWFSTNRDTVDAQETESFDATSDFPARDFYIFKVTAPTPWDAVTFGFPTVAPATVTSSADTVQRPPPEKSGADTIQDATDAVGKIAFWGVLIVGGVLALKTFDALSFLAPRR